MLKISEEQKQRIVNKMLDYQVLNGLKDAGLSRHVEINQSYYKSLKDGNWNNHPSGNGKTAIISDSIFRQIAEKVGYTFEVNYWEHFDTKNYTTITGAIVHGRKRKIPVTINGYSGAGKTYSLERYCRLFNVETFYIKVSSDMTERDVIVALAEAVGAQVEKGKYQMRKNIVAAILAMTDPCIILDELENLRMAAWGSIKAIYDDLENKTCLVLAGMDILEMIQMRALKRQRHFKQIQRRFEGTWRQMKPITAMEIDSITNYYQITDKEVKRWLFNNIKNYGSLQRVISTALKDREAGETINVESLKEIYFPQ